MSKKTRKKSAPPTRLTSTARTLQKRGGVATIAGGFVLLAGLLLVAALVFSDRQGTPAEEPLKIPAPDTRHMEAPVRRRLENARNAVERRPDVGPAWGAYAALCDAHSLYECAQTGYSMAIELDPQDYRWFYLQAFVSELRGASADQVAALYEQASRLEPRLPTTFYRLGEALTRAGRLDDAELAYRNAIELDPRLAVAYRGLGQVELAQGDALSALVTLGHAVDLGAAHNAATLASLAQAQLRVGDAAAADVTAQAAIEATEELPVPDPVRSGIRQMNISSAQAAQRAATLIQAGRYEAALEQMRIVEESHPEEASTHYRIGYCLAQLGKLREALPRLERAAQLAPGDAAARRELERVNKLLED